MRPLEKPIIRLREPNWISCLYSFSPVRALLAFPNPVNEKAARTVAAGVAALSALRARVRAAGGTVIGAGIHPDGAFGDVVHVDEPRYHRIVEQLQGLIKRTPTCALHVHVGMPDAQTAVAGGDLSADLTNVVVGRRGCSDRGEEGAPAGFCPSEPSLVSAEKKPSPRWTFLSSSSVALSAISV